MWLRCWRCLPPVAAKDKKTVETVKVPDLLMDGGRKLSFERSFSDEHEVKPKRGFFTRVVDVMIGAPDYKNMVRPYSVVTDSKGRVIVTDPGARGVHIFDFGKQKYKFLSAGQREEPTGNAAVRGCRCAGQHLRYGFRSGKDFCV